MLDHGAWEMVDKRKYLEKGNPWPFEVFFMLCGGKKSNAYFL
jgi:hypothetical protein